MATFKLLELTLTKMSLSFIFGLLLIKKCQGTVAVDIASFGVCGKQGETKSVILTWTDESLFNAKIESTTPPLADRYSTDCTMNTATQKCNTCLKNDGSNIESNCDTTKKIIWTFSTVELKNQGSYSIELTLSGGAGVIQKTIDLVVCVEPKDITLSCVTDDKNLVNCQCTAKSGRPESTVVWSIERTDKTSKNLDSYSNTPSFAELGDISSTLQYTLVKEDDKGNITCKVGHISATQPASYTCLVDCTSDPTPDPTTDKTKIILLSVLIPLCIVIIVAAVCLCLLFCPNKCEECKQIILCPECTRKKKCKTCKQVKLCRECVSRGLCEDCKVIIESSCSKCVRCVCGEIVLCAECKKSSICKKCQQFLRKCNKCKKRGSCSNTSCNLMSCTQNRSSCDECLQFIENIESKQLFQCGECKKKGQCQECNASSHCQNCQLPNQGRQCLRKCIKIECEYCRKLGQCVQCHQIKLCTKCNACIPCIPCCHCNSRETSETALLKTPNEDGQPIIKGTNFGNPAFSDEFNRTIVIDNKGSNTNQTPEISPGNHTDYY